MRLSAERETLEASAALLSETERRRAERFVFAEDRRRYVMVRARLRKLLAARLDSEPRSVDLAYGKFGKPALAGRLAKSGLRFNLSHCDDVVAFALSSDEVGIDVEAVRWIRDAEDIAARFFSRCENRSFRALDPLQKPLGFFNCWTRKEAFIKAVGDGLSYPLDRFDVSLAPDEPAQILRVEEKPGHQCGWRIEAIAPAPGFVGAVVTGNHSAMES